MNNSVITVSQVAPPAVGKKRGKITDTNGAVYQAGYPMLSSFQPGASYSIQWKVDSFNGFTFNVIESAVPAGRAGGTQGFNGQAPLPLSQTEAPMQMHVPGGTRAVPPPLPQLSDPLPERIFVCGGLNAILGNPTVEPAQITEDQMVLMVNTLRRTFARTFGGKTLAKDDMNDEIPF